MNKVIKLDKASVKCKKHNNIYAINEDLARVKGMVSMCYFPKRKEIREYIVKVHLNTYNNSPYKVSKKDIKRLENPRKYEVPVNVVEILEILVNEVKNNKSKMSYRANDNLLVSEHMITCTLIALNNLATWLNAHPIGERPQNDKYREEVSYVMEKLDKFDKKYGTNFNSLFK